MRVVLLSGIMEHPTPLASGATVDRPDHVAADWIARGLARAVVAPARAVESEPAPVIVAAALPVTRAEATPVAEAVAEADTVVVPSPKHRRRTVA